MTTKEKKQKAYLDRLIKRDIKYHQNETEQRNSDMINNLMDWNKENLSPNGGKKAFRRTQKEQMTKKPRGTWLSKIDEE